MFAPFRSGVSALPVSTCVRCARNRVFEQLLPTIHPASMVQVSTLPRLGPMSKNSNEANIHDGHGLENISKII